MNNNYVIAVLNAKYLHASPAPYCLAAGVKLFSKHLYQDVAIVESTVNRPLDETLNDILKLSPKIIGFCCYIWNIEKTLELISDIKKHDKDIITVVGGPEVSYNPYDILQNNSFVDFVLSGEGEQSFALFLNAIQKRSFSRVLTHAQRSDIDGLCGREQDGGIYVSQPAMLKGEIPSPLLADYHKNLGGRISYFETSRGCPFNCAFCLSGATGNARYFSLNEKLAQLQTLWNSETKTIKFVDRTFNSNKNHANAILRFILESYHQNKIPKDICFHFEIAADIVDKQTFQLLEKMPKGLIQLEIGIQSFHEKTLLAINRKTDMQKVKRNIGRLLSFKNMHIHIDLIAGLPFEDLHEFEKSFNTAYSLYADMLQLGFLKLLHGSDMREFPDRFSLEYGIKPPYQVVSTPWLSSDDLNLISHVEDALDRVYNSGRFLSTVEYIIKTTEISPFELYRDIGKAAKAYDFGERVSLDSYTEFLNEFFCSMENVCHDTVRDMMVQDRLATNNSGRLPDCLKQKDPRLKQAVLYLNSNVETTQKKGNKRAVALLNVEKNICYVDYETSEKNAFYKRYKLNKIPFEKAFKKGL